MIKIVVSNDVVSRDSIAIAGFPGMGFVGKTVAEYLAKVLEAKHVASIFCTGFPAHLIVKGGGTASLVKIDVYYANCNGKGIFVVTGDAQPMDDASQNELSYAIVEFLKQRGVSKVIAGAAYVTEAIVSSRRVFVAGSSNIVREFVEKVNAVPLEDGVITGMNGVIVGWAQVEGLSAACILGETWRSIVELEYVDYGAAKIVLDAINAVYGLGIDTDELGRYAVEIEKEIRKRFEMFVKREKSEGKERPYYIT